MFSFNICTRFKICTIQSALNKLLFFWPTELKTFHNIITEITFWFSQGSKKKKKTFYKTNSEDNKERDNSIYIKIPRKTEMVSENE